ncbi:cation:proton antiporter, partial [bacterium]|nr:cation:proton antiporter [bacterium]
GGPTGLYFIGSQGELEFLAELGVSLLLFSLGLEFSWEKLKGFGSSTLISGVLQVGATLIILSMICMFLGFETSTSMAIAATFTVSSTACVLRVLGERGETDSPYGRKSIAILLVQDITIVPLALLLTLLGTEGTLSQILYSVGSILTSVVLLTLGLYLFIHIAVTRVLGTFTIQSNRELSILLGTVIGLGTTWIAHEIGISPSLGAFLAGMLLGSSPFATQIRADITSVKTILLTLFFGAAGMAANPVWIFENLFLVLSTTVALLIFKALLIAGVLVLVKKSFSVALATGCTLSQVGEFAFVLGALALDLELIDEEIHNLVVSVAILSLFSTPFLISNAPKLGLALARLQKRTSPRETNNLAPVGKTPQPEVVVIGFGPAGQSAAAVFEERGEEVLIIDLNRQAQQQALQSGYSFLVGDAAMPEILEHAELESAKLFLVTIPHFQSTREIIRHLRELSPQARIVVRARSEVNVEALYQAGAHDVVSDEKESGVALSKHALHLVSGQS